MPLQRQKQPALHLAPLAADAGATLDELLGPRDARVGELREPASLAPTPELRRAAREVGVSTSLAVSLTAERELVARDLADEPELLAYLDARAVSARSRLPLSAGSAEYVRVLVGAINRRLAPLDADDAVVLVPTRLAERLRACPGLSLAAKDLRPALAWELAAVRAGRTMTEWALLEALRYRSAAERQSCAAASADR